MTRLITVTVTVLTALTELASGSSSGSWLRFHVAITWLMYAYSYACLDQEDELEELVMTYSRRGFPFSDEKLCILAYELAKQTRRSGFSPVKKRAGRKWLRGFLKRKPTLRKKNAQNLSAARAMAANPVQVQKFFQLLVQWVCKGKNEYKPISASKYI